VGKIAAELDALYPLDKLAERRERRDKALMELAKMKKKHGLM
jgi:hypothetical protein